MAPRSSHPNESLQIEHWFRVRAEAEPVESIPRADSTPVARLNRSEIGDEPHIPGSGYLGKKRAVGGKPSSALWLRRPALTGCDFGKPGLFRHISGTLEIQVIAVRVRKMRHPHAIANLWTGGLDSARSELAVDCHRVYANKTQGNALP
jgi:hypothetical protein